MSSVNGVEPNYNSAMKQRAFSCCFYSVICLEFSHLPITLTPKLSFKNEFKTLERAAGGIDLIACFCGMRVQMRSPVPDL